MIIIHIILLQNIPAPFISVDLIQPLLVTFAVLAILVAVFSDKKVDNTSISLVQTNQVVNVSLSIGLIELFDSSPQNTLNKRIQKENSS